MTKLWTPQSPIAPQEQGKGNLLMLAALAGGIWFLMRREGTGPGNGDNGGAQGLVTTSGQIGTITTTMGSHHVQKIPGQSITTRVPWSATAIDQNGTAVPWNFRIITRFGHNTFGFLTIWRTSGELGFPESGVRTANRFDTATPVSQQTFDVFVAPDDPNQEWDIRVALEAQRSDANGVPIQDDWVELAAGEHIGAVQTIGGQTTVAGNIGTISVSRRRNAVSISRR